MLVLSRGVGDAFDVGSDVHVKILSTSRNRVKVGIDAPHWIQIWRSELKSKPSELKSKPKDAASLRRVSAQVRDERGITVLLVEDDPGQARLIASIVADTVNAEVMVVASAEAAADLLWGADESLTAMSPPPLVLLDLHLPGLSGADLLRKIRSDSRLRRVPVVILSYSDNPLDVEQCLDRGANAFVTKPSNYEDFCASLSSVARFWGRESRLSQRLSAS